MALESLPKIAPALFSAEQDLIQIYNKKSDTVGVINPSYIKSSPSGVSGAIQFSDGSAFASDATNLFWDDTNNRLGVVTNAPSVPFEVLGNAWINAATNADATFSIGNPSRRWDVKALQTGAYYQVVYNNGNIGQSIDYLGNVAFGNVATLGARLGIKGSGSTSATTSLLVQNSAGTEALRVYDDGTISAWGGNTLGYTTNILIGGRSNTANISFYGNKNIFIGEGGSAENNPSALLSMGSTTKGFLPPRQTVAQRTAIVSPAVGLMVYQTDGTEGLYIYKSTGWTFIA